jgi:tetratricopeptide (TPR) repeat protein
VLWAESYERDLRDVVALQGEVARRIAVQIKARLTKREEGLLSRAEPVDPEAYHAYLRGRHLIAKKDEQDIRQGIDLIRHALDLESDYAPAWVALSEGFYQLSNIYMTPDEAMPQAREAARKALAIDDTLAEAHAALALVHLIYDWDWPMAEREYRRAIDLSPGNASARQGFGLLLLALGRFTEAAPELQRA